MTGGKSKEWTYISWNLKLNINVQATQLRIFSSTSSHKHWRPRENRGRERACKLTVDKPSPPKENLDISQGIWNALSCYYKLPFTYCILPIRGQCFCPNYMSTIKLFMYGRCLAYMKIERMKGGREVQGGGDIGDIYINIHVYTYDWFMLMFGRNQHNSVKQVSLNSNNKFKF